MSGCVGKQTETYEECKAQHKAEARAEVVAEIRKKMPHIRREFSKDYTPEMYHAEDEMLEKIDKILDSVEKGGAV